MVALLTGLAVTSIVAAFFLTRPAPWSLRLDNKMVMWPMTVAAWTHWTSGRVPVWTDAFWGGFPLLADAVTAAFYLPHAIPLALTAFPHVWAFDLATALHVGLLGGGSCLLLARLGSRAPAAVFGGLLAALGVQVWNWAAGFLPCLVAITWWPIVLLGAERLATDDAPAPGLVIASVALAAEVLAGYPEFGAHAAVMGAAWLVLRRGRIGLRRRVLRLLALGVLTVFLAAPQLVPSVFEMRDSFRAVRPMFAQALFLPAHSLLALLDVRADGLRPVTPYLGLGTCILAVMGVRGPRGVFLLAAALLAGLTALGEQTPVYGMLSRLPPFDHFRGPFKFFTLSEMAMAWLAALGLERLLGSRRLFVVLAACLLAALALGERVLYFRLHHRGRVSPPADELAVDDLLATLRDGIVPGVTVGPGEPPPWLLVVALNHRLGNSLALVDLDGVRGGTTAFLSERHLSLLELPLRPAVRDLVGVQLVFVPAPGCRSGDLPVIRRTRWGCLLRNPTWPARYVAGFPAEAVETPEIMMERVLTRDHASAPVPVVSAPATVPTAPVPAQVVVHEHRAGTASVGVDTPAPTLLLVRESWKPGWSATVDRAPAPVLRAAGLYFAVPVPAGRHEVVVRFVQPGLAVGLVGLPLWALAIAALARRGHGVRPSGGASGRATARATA